MTAGRRILALVVMCLALVPVPTWAAASRPGYENVPGAAGEGGLPSPAPLQSEARGGSLPFTGADLAIAALAGAGLLSAGLLIRMTRGA